MPKEYTLIGGNGTRVSPLEVNESGTYEAGDSRAFNPVKVNVPSGSSTLSGLTDVDISNPTDGQTLVYNATSGKWKNGSAGGGGGLIVHVSQDEQTFVYTLDKTWQEIADAMLLGVVQLIEVDEVSHAVLSYQIDGVTIDGDKYCVDFSSSYSGRQYSADSANGYPYYQPD